MIIPDNDSQIPQHTSSLMPGEKALVLSMADYKQRGPDVALGMYLGRKPTSDRCAVINHAGYVAGVVHADPWIDRHPAGRLHRAPTSVPGQLAVGLGLLP